jgi:hypothetical protein
MPRNVPALTVSVAILTGVVGTIADGVRLIGVDGLSVLAAPR